MVHGMDLHIKDLTIPMRETPPSSSANLPLTLSLNFCTTLMPSPNLRQYSDNAFLPRDMKCLGYDAQKNCYVFRKNNEIWLGIFGQRWDGARLVRFGNIQQSTLDEGALDDLSAIPEYPPDYTEDPESMPRPVANRLSTSSWTPETPTSTTELSVRTVPGSPSADDAEVVATQWGAANTGITASGARPPDNEHRLRQRASHIISSMIPHPHPHLHRHNRNSLS